MASTTLQPQHSTASTTTITTQYNYNPPSSSTSSHLTSKKRALDHASLLYSSPYFKIRAIVKELRPLFLEVLRAPDIQNCEAGRGIEEKMKLIVDLCRHKAVENVPLVQFTNGAGSQDLASEKQGGQKTVLMSHEGQPQVDRSFMRPAGNNLEKQTQDGNRIPGTYIVGGSAFGWNFITFHGTKPEYYGRTKEAFRAGQAGH